MLLLKNFTSLPSPASISYWWNFGSLLGVCLSLQLLTGVFLALQFTGEASFSFNAVVRLMQDVNFGWVLRTLHANGASAFFVCLFLHTGRGLYYSSYSYTKVWLSGVSMFLLVMAAAFLGYVLPWGQMSFWGASVITSLIQAVPYLGADIVTWLWGGFSVDSPTLMRFFAFHFLVPFIVAALSLVHLFVLHSTGSKSPSGLTTNTDKLEFHGLFSFKDFLGLIVFVVLLLYVVLILPVELGDPENFIMANPLVTPVHIQPEWYFLFAYAILRSIPNKLGGVIALALSVLVLYFMPLLDYSFSTSSSNNWLIKLIFWTLVSTVGLLTWIGARPVKTPYILIGQLLTCCYFFLYFMIFVSMKISNLNLYGPLKTTH